MTLTIPPEGQYSETERDWIDLEPPGLFPEGQDSLWGQMRKVFADYIDTNLRQMFVDWWQNLDPVNANVEWLTLFEQNLGLPVSNSALTREQRLAFVLARMKRGAWTRTLRASIVEAFIIPTFGIAPRLTSDGIPLDAGGVALYSDTFSLEGTYNIVEDIEDFSYDVRILNTIAVDEAGLTRELTRITPAGISFTVTMTATP